MRELLSSRLPPLDALMVVCAKAAKSHRTGLRGGNCGVNPKHELEDVVLVSMWKLEACVGMPPHGRRMHINQLSSHAIWFPLCGVVCVHNTIVLGVYW